MGWQDGKPVSDGNNPAWMAGKPTIDFQGLQREKLDSERISQEVQNDPISRGAKRTLNPSLFSADAPDALLRWFYGDPNATVPQRVAQNPLVRTSVGAGDMLMGPAQLAQNYLADTSNALTGALGVPGKMERSPLNDSLKTYDEMRQAGGATGFDMMRLGGNLLSPVSIGMMKIAPAASAMGRVGQGAGIGAATALATPVSNGGENYWKDKGKQTLMATLLGGGIAGGVEAGRAGARLVDKVLEPTYESGRAAILNRYQQGLAGDKGPQMAAQLRQAGEIVPGSAPTAGEALTGIPEATGLAAHQQAISGNPLVSSQFAARASDQQAARANLIQRGAGTTKELESLIGQRGADATKNYGAAYQQKINADPELARLAVNPYFKDALPDALKLAESRGVTPKSDLTEFMHLVKISLDKQIGKTGDAALANAERAEVSGVKNALTSWLAKKNPSYDFARSEFAAQSKPINNMQIMQEMSKRLTDPSGKETGATFLRAIDDRTPEAASRIIKKTTGFDRYEKLSDAITPQNMSAVQSVADDLTRTLQYGRSAQGTNISGAAGIAEKSEGQLPNLLSRPAMVANWVMKKLGEGADEKIVKLAASRYLNPKELADALEAATTAGRGAAFAEQIRKGGIAATIGGSAAAAQGVQQ